VCRKPTGSGTCAGGASAAQRGSGRAQQWRRLRQAMAYGAERWEEMADDVEE
jgi:hypothetical protein